MPGNTPKLKLPYPLPGEPVRDGAAEIRKLAEALENEIATGPPVMFYSILDKRSYDWSDYPDARPQARKIGSKTRQIFGTFQKLNNPQFDPGTETLMGVLKEGWRPNRQVRAPMAGPLGTGVFTIYPDGRIWITNHQTANGTNKSRLAVEVTWEISND